MDSIQALVSAWGCLGLLIFVLLGNFGLPFLAGPLAGSLDLPWRSFLIANVLGALCYVPIMVGASYAAGYGLSGYMEWIQQGILKAEQSLLAGMAVFGLCFLGYRALQRHRNGLDA